MVRWLALAAALAGLAVVWAKASGAAGWAVGAAALAAAGAGLILAARFGALDEEADWVGQIGLAVRLRARQAPRWGKDRRPGFVRVRLGPGADRRHAALASHLGAAGIGVDLDHDSLLVYAADDSPAMAAHLGALEALASAADAKAAS
ncbi:MAG: hypothetical protein ACOYJ6_17680 [Caulobacterales bacterium]|jgi:hypothetical protein